jgi:hypothetical protein
MPIQILDNAKSSLMSLLRKQELTQYRRAGATRAASRSSS